MNQHKKACATCPFSKRSTPGELGGSPVEMFVGQAYGAFWLPCHEAVDYSDPNWKQKYEAAQCAGAAIYRSNCHPAKRPVALLNLPADSDENVFKSPAEFVAHHMRVSIGMADTLVKVITPESLHEIECKKAEAKFISEEEFKK
jgi:hypothetical protein